MAIKLGSAERQGLKWKIVEAAALGRFMTWAGRRQFFGQLPNSVVQPKANVLVIQPTERRFNCINRTILDASAM